jgi:hypothetical protein
MLWHVITFPETTYPLLTSDWPVELAFNQGAVSLPIGPRKLFVAAASEDILKRIVRTPFDKLAKSMNRLVVERARKYVYAHDTSQTEFVRNHLSKNKEPSPLYPSLGGTHAQTLTKVRTQKRVPPVIEHIKENEKEKT